MCEKLFSRESSRVQLLLLIIGTKGWLVLGSPIGILSETGQTFRVAELNMVKKLSWKFTGLHKLNAFDTILQTTNNFHFLHRQSIGLTQFVVSFIRASLQNVFFEFVKVSKMSLLRIRCLVLVVGVSLFVLMQISVKTFLLLFVCPQSREIKSREAARR